MADYNYWRDKIKAMYGFTVSEADTLMTGGLPWGELSPYIDNFLVTRTERELLNNLTSSPEWIASVQNIISARKAAAAASNANQAAIAAARSLANNQSFVYTQLRNKIVKDYGVDVLPDFGITEWIYSQVANGSTLDSIYAQIIVQPEFVDRITQINAARQAAADSVAVNNRIASTIQIVSAPLGRSTTSTENITISEMVRGGKTEQEILTFFAPVISSAIAEKTAIESRLNRHIRLVETIESLIGRDTSKTEKDSILYGIDSGLTNQQIIDNSVAEITSTQPTIVLDTTAARVSYIAGTSEAAAIQSDLDKIHVGEISPAITFAATPSTNTQPVGSIVTGAPLTVQTVAANETALAETTIALTESPKNPELTTTGFLALAAIIFGLIA